MFTLEEIRKKLNDSLAYSVGFGKLREEDVEQIVNSIVAIRSDAYDQGWSDALRENSRIREGR